MRLLPTIIAFLLLAFAQSLEAQPIRFVRESLEFTLADDSFSFSGLYYFDNPGAGAAEQFIFYPYVTSGSLPDSVSIVEVRSGRHVPVKAGSSGVSFGALLDPVSTHVYRVVFNQRAPQRSFEYILKTTAAWGRPLDRMTIRIHAPSGLHLESVSLEPDTVRGAGGMITYVIDRERFMPDRNLIVEWKRKAP